jgi:hypothetical protein
MTTLREAAQQALEALDVFANAIRVWPEETWAPHEFAAMDKGEAAITALKAALAQPEQPEQPEQEPLAIATVDESLGVVFKFSRSHTLLPGQMLYVYTHPPRREQEQEPVDAEAALRVALAQRDWAFKQLQAQPDRREWRGLSQEEIDRWTPEIHPVILAIEAELKELNHE